MASSYLFAFATKIHECQPSGSCNFDRLYDSVPFSIRVSDEPDLSYARVQRKFSTARECVLAYVKEQLHSELAVLNKPRNNLIATIMRLGDNKFNEQDIAKVVHELQDLAQTITHCTVCLEPCDHLRSPCHSCLTTVICGSCSKHIFYRQCISCCTYIDSSNSFVFLA